MTKVEQARKVFRENLKKFYDAIDNPDEQRTIGVELETSKQDLLRELKHEQESKVQVNGG